MGGRAGYQAEPLSVVPDEELRRVGFGHDYDACTTRRGRQLADRPLIWNYVARLRTT